MIYWGAMLTNMEEDKDNFTFWFLAGVLLLVSLVIGGVMYFRGGNELEYQRPPEVVIPKGDTIVVPPTWECPEGKDCKG